MPNYGLTYSFKLSLVTLSFLLVFGFLFLKIVNATETMEFTSCVLVKYKEMPFSTQQYKDAKHKTLAKKNIHLINVHKSEDIEQLIKELKKDPNVLYAVPDYKRELTGVITNDPYFPQQWALTNINAPQAWEIEKGSNSVIIAVIDSGVNKNHPDLAGRVIEGFNFVNLNNNTDDVMGHGTFVAGIIGAVPNNGLDVAGVNWNATILPFQVFYYDSLKKAWVANDSDIIAAIYKAVESGARIINLSLGGPDDDPLLKEALSFAADSGVVTVAATGNDGADSILYPAAYPIVIAVGATDVNNNITDFTNHGNEMDIVAPGKDVLGLDWLGGVKVGSGTSFSTPYVSSGISLLLSKNLNLSVAEITFLLQETAFDLSMPGYDQYSGYGLLDLNSLLMTQQAYAISTYDFDGNGIVDLYDMVSLSRNIGNSSADLNLYDLNGDGIVSKNDLINLFSYVINFNN